MEPMEHCPVISEGTGNACGSCCVPGFFECFAKVPVAVLEYIGYRVDFEHMEANGWGRFHYDNKEDIFISSKDKSKMVFRAKNFYTKKVIPDENMEQTKPSCNVCGRGFSTIYTLRRHEKLHTKPRIPCPSQECRRDFASQDNLKEHWKFVHDHYVLSCPDCCKNFKSRSARWKHMKKNHSNRNNNTKRDFSG